EEADYRGLKVVRPSLEVADAEVDTLLDSLRERFAELETVQRPATTGDFVVIDLRATVHEDEVPEATRQDFLYEVGTGEFTGALDEQLEGKRAGEILKFNAQLDQRFGDRAGQEVSFQVLVKEVKGKHLPAADDAFAKTASEFDTLDELKASLREQIGVNKERAADAEVRDRVLQRLVDATEVDLPETLIDDETEHRVQHARERAQQLGVTLDELLEAQGMDEERFRDEAREHAVRAIVADLILEGVARSEDLQVSAEEVSAEVDRLAKALGRERKEVAASLDRTGQVVTLAGDIIRSKALDVLVEHADVTPEDGAAPETRAPEAPSDTPEDKPEDA
ncbi:MAG TPA: trigger factor, partial [Actinomycetota bacterium]|nr:trigger factor [Actinomycetota bacterium]